ncbi:MAG TPA: outer membrane protein assembly factor BamD [Thermoanaerobaculia bacterium]|nr:outer membrane protein assembly factor BamD [Thermoanaerobaculia bacterium]
MKRLFLLLLTLGLTTAIGACRSGGAAEDPILRLSAQESMEIGKDLLAKEKYARARPYLLHAYEVEPNSAMGREALLLSADTFFLEGASQNYVQAEAKYRDFLNRFPTSQQAPYVQFQIANSLAKRMEKPDRDQTTTRKALEAYQELIRIYPTSEYAVQAQLQIEKVRANLAEHEFVVGRFYMRYGAPGAAIQRFVELLANYPQYGERDKVIYNLGLAYERSGRSMDAIKTFDRLRAEHPQSSFIAEIPEIRPAAATGGDKDINKEKASEVG